MDNLSIRLTDENWKKVLDLNLTSAFLMCKFSIKKMLKNKAGKIINISSIVEHTGNIGRLIIQLQKQVWSLFQKSCNGICKILILIVYRLVSQNQMTDKINEEFKKI